MVGGGAAVLGEDPVVGAADGSAGMLLAGLAVGLAGLAVGLAALAVGLAGSSAELLGGAGLGGAGISPLGEVSPLGSTMRLKMRASTTKRPKINTPARASDFRLITQKLNEKPSAARVCLPCLRCVPNSDSAGGLSDHRPPRSVVRGCR